MTKIRVFDPISPQAVKELSSIAEVVESTWDFDIAIVRSKTKVTKEFIDKAKNLKLVLRAGVGLDNIDVDYCKIRGIDVKNTSQASAVSVAELVFALLLSIARRTVQMTEEIKKGHWLKEGGFELSGKTLGIVGYGNVGREVAKRARSFGMIVVIHDPYITKADFPVLGLKELLHVSDIITLHLPITKETESLINAKTIDEMKDGVILINTSRGEIIDERDLYNALVSGKISFAGLDVFRIEPPDSKLLELKNVVLTPHIGGSTADASDRIGNTLIEQIKDYVKKQTREAGQRYLITVSSKDRPGITATLTEILSKHHVSILDAEQATIQGILALSFLVEMDDSTKDHVTKDLKEKAQSFDINLSITSFGEVIQRNKTLYALTCLTSVPRGEVLTQISKILYKNNANIETIRQITGEELVALELLVDVNRSPDIEKLKQEIMVTGKELGFDVALQKESVFRKSKRMIVFNMEGALIDVDTIEEIAKVAGASKTFIEIGENAIKNDFDSKQILNQRVALLKGVSIDVLEYVSNKISLTKGTRELISLLKNMGYKVAIISSSFTFFTDKLKEELDLDYAYGNKLIIKDGYLTGKLEDPIIDGEAKAHTMLEIAEREKIPVDQIVAVGNGVDDIEMLNNAGLGIVFHAKGDYKSYIDGAIVQTNLKSILYMIGASEEKISSE